MSQAISAIARSIGEEEKLVAGERGETCHIIGLPGQDATDRDMVLAEGGTGAHAFVDFNHDPRIGRRAEEAQHHPAARADMQIERSACYQRRAEQRHGITENYAINARLLIDHGRAFAYALFCRAKR
jgi:hypothetical protein